jgi:hypothetical protein
MDGMLGNRCAPVTLAQARILFFDPPENFHLLLPFCRAASNEGP